MTAAVRGAAGSKTLCRLR